MKRTIAFASLSILYDYPTDIDNEKTLVASLKGMHAFIERMSVVVAPGVYLVELCPGCRTSLEGPFSYL